MNDESKKLSDPAALLNLCDAQPFAGPQGYGATSSATRSWGNPPKGPRPVKVWEGPHPGDRSCTLRALMRVDESIEFESLAFDALGQPAWHPVLVSTDVLHHIAAQFVKHISNLEVDLHRQVRTYGEATKAREEERKNAESLLNASRQETNTVRADLQAAHTKINQQSAELLSKDHAIEMWKRRHEAISESLDSANRSRQALAELAERLEKRLKAFTPKKRR